MERIAPTEANYSISEPKPSSGNLSLAQKASRRSQKLFPFANVARKQDPVPMFVKESLYHYSKLSEGLYGESHTSVHFI